jgi:hypothetical protein
LREGGRGKREEGGWREDGGRMEGGWREDGGRMEGRRREDGGRWREEWVRWRDGRKGRWREDGGKIEGKNGEDGREGKTRRISVRYLLRFLVLNFRFWIIG